MALKKKREQKFDRFTSTEKPIRISTSMAPNQQQGQFANSSNGKISRILNFCSRELSPLCYFDSVWGKLFMHEIHA